MGGNVDEQASEDKPNPINKEKVDVFCTVHHTLKSVTFTL